jgi:4-hydroxy-3-polyprenylbenzoate decarboxylase
VTCITRRRNAIYHDYGSGLPDMLVPDNFLMEAKLYGMIKAVCPALVNVHVPESGRRFHAYIQLKSASAGETRDALMSALSYRRIKTAIVLDEDVDIYDDREVMWALATRVQWHRDTIQVMGLSGSTLDPSLPLGATTTSKIGIDATLTAPQTGTTPQPFLPRTRVRAEALKTVESLLAGSDPKNWPQQ